MELSMIARVVSFVVVLSFVQARELEKCTEFEYQEHLLAKLIRMEIGFENVLSKVKEMQDTVNTVLGSLNVDRNKLSQELERLTRMQEEALNRTVEETNAVMKRVLANTEDGIKNLERDTVSTVSGLCAIYTRWGRTVCPNESTAVYSGYAASSHHNENGGAVETVCLPKDPQFSRHHASRQGSYLYGTEYDDSDARLTSTFGKSLRHQDMPCVVCKATGRSSILTVPARTECYSGWMMEYNGYLMTRHHRQKKATLKCVDADPETIPGVDQREGGDFLYLVETAGQLPDPPYTRGKELTCVVCTQ